MRVALRQDRRMSPYQESWLGFLEMSSPVRNPMTCDLNYIRGRHSQPHWLVVSQHQKHKGIDDDSRGRHQPMLTANKRDNAADNSRTAGDSRPGKDDQENDHTGIAVGGNIDINWIDNRC